MFVDHLFPEDLFWMDGWCLLSIQTAHPSHINGWLQGQYSHFNENELHFYSKIIKFNSNFIFISTTTTTKKHMKFKALSTVNLHFECFKSGDTRNRSMEITVCGCDDHQFNVLLSILRGLEWTQSPTNKKGNVSVARQVNIHIFVYVLTLCLLN